MTTAAAATPSPRAAPPPGTQCRRRGAIVPLDIAEARAQARVAAVVAECAALKARADAWARQPWPGLPGPRLYPNAPPPSAPDRPRTRSARGPGKRP